MPTKWLTRERPRLDRIACLHVPAGKVSAIAPASFGRTGARAAGARADPSCGY